MRKLLLALCLAASALLFNCLDKNAGEAPLGPAVNKDTVTTKNTEFEAVGNLRMFATPFELPASNSDQAEIKLVAFNQSNNPLAGVPVAFHAVHGIVGGESVTDSLGVAKTVYQSVPINAVDTVTGTLVLNDSIHSVKTSIRLTGVSVAVEPASSDAEVDKSVSVTLRVLDAAGLPVPEAILIITGATDDTGKADGDGVFVTSVTRDSEGRADLTAKALGAEGKGFVDFWAALEKAPAASVDSIRKMRIFSSKSQLKADNSDFAQITVILTDKDNTPALADTVKFSSNLGIVDKYALVDSNGRATVKLRSSPVNGLCTVSATALGRSLSVKTDLIFSGITLQLIPDKTELKIGEYSIIEAFLKDGSNNPIGGDEARFNLTGSDASFANDSAVYTTSLSPDGKAKVRVKAAKAGEVLVRGYALNTADSIVLTYSNNSLSLKRSTGAIRVGGRDSVRIEARYVDGANKPIKEAWIVFATNAGEVSRDSVKTNSDGEAKTWLRSAKFAGTATVQATAEKGTAQIQVNFLSYSPYFIALSITADNIGVNGGIATLTAVVTDSNGNRVSGRDVNFKILKGPGGGEYITKPVVKAQSGVAISQLAAGSLPSQYRGTEVMAAVGTIADTSKLTISGTPHIVTVARPEDDTLLVEKAGNLDPATFRFNIGAVVQDINGNNVADGTEVHFSAVVSGMSVAQRMFVHWAGLQSLNLPALDENPFAFVRFDRDEIKAVYGYHVIDIPFEDINQNRRMDKNIDLMLDYDNMKAARGDDRDGNGSVDYNPIQHDFFWDFNLDGLCDSTRAEPALYPEYTTGIIKIDTTVDTSIGIINKQIITYDTLVEIGRDTTVTYDTAFGIAYDTAVIYDTVISVGDDTLIIDDTTITLVYDVDTVTVYDTALIYQIEEKTDTTIRMWPDTVLIDTTIDGSRVCDTAADTTNQHIYLVHCQDDSTFIQYDIVIRIDTNLSIVQDTVGTELDITTKIDYDTTGTRYDTSVTTRYEITPTRDTTVNIIYEINARPDTIITPKYRFTPKIDTLINPVYRTRRVVDTTVITTYDTTYSKVDSTAYVYADLNRNGVWDKSEWVDVNNNGIMDLPDAAIKGRSGAYVNTLAYDFRFTKWEMRPMFLNDHINFDRNDFAVVIEASATTKNGVANTQISYPRQFARRLIVTINCETNGIRDKDGERFTLPVIIVK